MLPHANPVTAGMYLELRADALALSDGASVNPWNDSDGTAPAVNFTLRSQTAPVYRINQGSAFFRVGSQSNASISPTSPFGGAATSTAGWTWTLVNWRSTTGCSTPPSARVSRR